MPSHPLRATVIVALSLLWSAALPAQTTLSLDLGPAADAVNDRLLSPIRSDGVVTSFTVGLAIEGEEDLHQVALDGSVGTVSNRFGMPALGARLGLEYRYLREFWRGESDAWRILGGPMVQGGTRLHHYSLLDESHLYWLTAYELGGGARYQRRIGEEGRLAADVWFPLFAVAARPEANRTYNNDLPMVGEVLSSVNSDLVPCSVGNYLGVDLALGYRFPISASLEQEVRYALRYRRSSAPELGEWLTHAFTLGLSVRL